MKPITKTVWVQQPKGFALPSTAFPGTQLLVNPAFGNWNAVNGAAPSLQTATASNVSGLYGLAKCFGSTPNVTAIQSTTNFALLAQVDFSASPGAYSAIFGGDTTGNRQFQLRFNVASQVEFIRFDTTVSDILTITTPTSIGRRGTVLAIAIGNSMYLWFKSIGSVSGMQSASGTNTGTPQPVTFVASGGGYTTYDQNTGSSDQNFGYAVLRGDVALSKYAELLDNPWQVFRAPRKPFLKQPTVAGYPTLTGVQGTTAVGSIIPQVWGGISGAQGTSAAGTVADSDSPVLTGVAGNSAAGAIADKVSVTLTGAQATSSPGVVVPAVSQNMTGVAGTSAAGAITSSVSVALSGAVATSAAGSVTTSSSGSASYTLTGVQGTSSAGALTAKVSASLIGAQGNSASGSIIPSVSVTLSGAQANSSAGAVSTQAGGSASYTLTGVQASSSAGIISVSAGSSYTLSGAQAVSGSGMVTPAVIQTMAGVSATSGVGTLSSRVSAFLAGVQITSTAGSVTVPVNAQTTLTGVQAITAVGGILPEVLSLAGVKATSYAGTITTTAVSEQPAIMAANDESAYLMSLSDYSLYGMQIMDAA